MTTPRFDTEAERVAMVLAGERPGELVCGRCARPCWATLGDLCWRCVDELSPAKRPYWDWGGPESAP